MQLETERLILRSIDPERDFEPWARLQADPEAVRYTNGDVQNRAEAWRGMAGAIGHWQIRGYGFFSVEHKVSGEWVGRVGPWYPEGWPAREIGWSIVRDYWGRGYATEAARACLEHVFGTLGWDSVIHLIMEGNDASARVASKIGSELLRTREGLGTITDEVVHIYGQDAPGR
jgi:RimJ/RimL family protein N-acetyltransferase